MLLVLLQRTTNSFLDRVLLGLCILRSFPQPRTYSQVSVYPPFPALGVNSNTPF